MPESACLQMLRALGYPLAGRRCGIRRRVGMRAHAQFSELRVPIHQTPMPLRNDGKSLENRVDFVSASSGRAQAEE